MDPVLHHVREGAGEPLVLLHPVGLDLSCWDAVTGELQSEFEIIRLDLPGHGKSPRPAPHITLSGYAAAVHGTLRSLGIGRAHILGLSFGGMIAQTIAIEHPEQCASLIAAGCPCTIPSEDRAARAQRGRIVLTEGMGAVVDSTLERWFTPGFLNSGSAEPTRNKLLRQDTASWCAAWEAISCLATKPLLHTITVTALCIAGDEDRATSVEAVREIAQKIPGAEFAILPGAPHMMQLERPGQFSGIARAFLRQLQ